MENGAFLHDNLLDGYSSISANTEATGYDVERVVNGIPAEQYKSTGSPAQVDFIFTTAQDFKAIAIINHNIQSRDTVEIKFSNDDFSTISETVDISDSYHALNFFHKFTATKSYKGLRVLVTASAGVAIGELFAGDYFALPINYNWDFKPTLRIHEQRADINGQLFRNIISKQRGFGLAFENVPAENWVDFARLYEAPVVFIPDAEDPECFHGNLAGEFDPANSHDVLSFPLTFWQNALKMVY